MTLCAAEAANMPLLPARGAGHYEVWYLTGSASERGLGFWLRSTLHWPKAGCGDQAGKLWLAIFEAGTPTRIRAVVRAFPWAQVEIAPERFLVRIGGAEFAHDHLRGQMRGTPYGDLAWELRWTPATEVVDCLPAPLRNSRLLKTLWRCPNQDIQVSGFISAANERYPIDAAPATQSHIIGRRHAKSWCWGHAAGFSERPDACVEFLTAGLGKRTGVSVLRVALGGEVFAFTGLRDLWRNRAHFTPGRYLLTAARDDRRFELEISWSPDQMVQAEYHDPDGTPRFCHNTEIASATLRRFRPARFGGAWELAEELRAPQRVCFEYGAMSADASVTARYLDISPPP